MSTFIGVVIGIVIAALISGLIIYVVGKLGLGLEVDSFGSAIWAGIIIAGVSAIITWLLGLVGISLGGSSLLSAIISLITAAIVLLISDKLLSGLRVAGFLGALIAAAAIGVGHWLVAWAINLIL